MDRAKAIAEEISWLVPKLLRGLRAGFVAAPQITTSQMVTLMRIYEKDITRVGDLIRLNRSIMLTSGRRPLASTQLCMILSITRLASGICMNR